jgi:hypothetical protein
MHHPDWKGMMGNLLDTLVKVGRREEALGYLVAFGAGTCEVALPADATAEPLPSLVSSPARAS